MKIYLWLKKKLINSLFIKLYLSILLIVITSVFISSQITEYIFQQSKIEKTDKTLNDIKQIKDKLVILLTFNRIDSAIELLINNPKITKQIFVFDQFDNEILNRYFSGNRQPEYLFAYSVSKDLVNNHMEQVTIVDTIDGDSYTVVINPLIHYSPLLSPSFIGSILRLVSLIIIAAIACYYFASSFTRRIKILRQKIEKINLQYISNKKYLITKQGDDLDQLSSDFDLMARTLDKSNQLRRNILSDISHEIRSPLARMQVTLELMRQQHPDAEKHIERIYKENNQIDYLIEQIINIHKVQIDSMITKERFDLSNLIQLTINDVNYEYQKLNKQAKIANKSTIFILANKEKIKIALENIIRNGMSYTNEHTYLEVKFYKKESLVYIEIKDHGDGLDNEQLDNIFEPFVRLDSSRNRSSGGFGLGLSIAKQIILQHSGYISAENCTDHSGLCIKIILPQ